MPQVKILVSRCQALFALGFARMRFLENRNLIRDIYSDIKGQQHNNTTTQQQQQQQSLFQINLHF